MKQFKIQWNLTDKCKNQCKHCYIADAADKPATELSFSDCLKVLEDIEKTINNWGIAGRISFTGGDPLLRKEIFDLIERVSEKKIEVRILGNPEHVTQQTAQKLKSLGVTSYMLSLDGLEKTHDFLRGKGSFNRTLKAIKILNSASMHTLVMFTLSKRNADELIPVIDLVAREKVAEFNFSRLVPVGRGARFAKELIEPDEYRKLLIKVLEEYSRLKDRGHDTVFGRRESLWNLLYQEMGVLSPSKEDKKTIFGGCPIGASALTILTDGTVYPCRRLPVKIGKVPEQRIEDIFVKSAELNKMRAVEKMQRCGRCDLIQYCRGCPAVAYATSGSYYKSDPQCWKA